MSRTTTLPKAKKGATKDQKTEVKLTPAQLRLKCEELEKKLENLQYKFDHSHRCIICGEMKMFTDNTRYFYNNRDPMCRSTATAICRDCATKIARRAMSDGVEKEPTKNSVRQALFYMNKPFLEKVWDDSVKEYTNEEYINRPEDVWKAYARHIQNHIYDNLTYMDSDGLTSFKMEQEKNRIAKEEEKMSRKEQRYLDKLGDDIKSTFMANKKTVIRFLGYDPFENDPIEDQPVLYAKLVNYFDDSVREDGLKLEAVIEIVQSFKNIKVMNETIDKYRRELGDDPNAISTISKLTDTKKKIVDSALALAKDNGISVNHNKQSRKGAGTLSGIIKEMNEMNLDDIEINTFDYETSQAMAQVEANSIKNILTQLNPDENDWQREIARQTDIMFKLQDERDKAVEYCRLLRKENKDLKDFMKEHNWIDSDLNVIEDNVVSEQGGETNG